MPSEQPFQIINRQQCFRDSYHAPNRCDFFTTSLSMTFTFAQQNMTLESHVLCVWGWRYVVLGNMMFCCYNHCAYPICFHSTAQGYHVPVPSEQPFQIVNRQHCFWDSYHTPNRCHFLQPVFEWPLRLHNKIWRFNPMYCVFESDVMQFWEDNILVI